jgi:hypothetical protein
MKWTRLSLYAPCAMFMQLVIRIWEVCFSLNTMPSLAPGFYKSFIMIL